MRTFLNFFRQNQSESMARLVEFIGVVGCIALLWRWVELTKGDPTYAIIGIVGIVVTGKAYQRNLDLKKEMSDKAIDAGAPLKEQPPET